MDRVIIGGWGMSPLSAARVRRLGSSEDLPRLLEDSVRRGSIARGLGRSYGDAAQRAGGTVVLVDDRDIEWLGDGVVKVGAGASYDDLLAEVVPRGWFVPVTPGTRQVSIGGAVAADVHGKNHHVDGSLGAHVERLGIVLPDGEARELTPDGDAELFWATIGGMGLTGFIRWAVMRLLPIETSRMAVEARRAKDLDAVMAALDRDRHRYSVAWVDLMAKGARLGRGEVIAGDHEPRGGSSDPIRFQAPRRLGLPAVFPPGLVNRVTARAFNEAWFRKASRHRVVSQSIGGFFHPLDAIAHWNRVYGRTGFVQYQFVVPDPEDFVTITRRLAESGVPSSLTVLKRMGEGNPGLLSFPMRGWTLAVDFPITHGLDTLLDHLDELVVEAGGRVYLAKDSRMRPEVFRAMYPGVDGFAEVRARVDPGSRLRSDQAVRLGIP